MSQKDQPEAGAPGAGDQADQPTGLENLEAEVMALESKPVAQVQAEMQQQAQQAAAELADLGNELAGALEMVRDMAVEATEERELLVIWADPRLKGIGMAGAAVMKKYGWDVGQVMKWAPEIALVASVMVPAMQTVKLVKLRQAEALARSKPPAEGAPA